jgi:hypothetical protein
MSASPYLHPPAAADTPSVAAAAAMVSISAPAAAAASSGRCGPVVVPLPPAAVDPAPTEDSRRKLEKLIAKYSKPDEYGGDIEIKCQDGSLWCSKRVLHNNCTKLTARLSGPHITVDTCMSTVAVILDYMMGEKSIGLYSIDCSSIALTWGANKFFEAAEPKMRRDIQHLSPSHQRTVRDMYTYAAQTNIINARPGLFEYWTKSHFIWGDPDNLCRMMARTLKTLERNPYIAEFTRYLESTETHPPGHEGTIMMSTLPAATQMKLRQAELIPAGTVLSKQESRDMVDKIFYRVDRWVCCYRTGSWQYCYRLVANEEAAETSVRQMREQHLKNLDEPSPKRAPDSPSDEPSPKRARTDDSN